MSIRRFVVSATTDASGDAEVYSPVLSGKIHSIRYVKPGSGNFTDGVDFVITSETAGETIWSEENVNASASRYPRAASHTVAGVAATYDGTRAALVPIALSQDRVKIVVASGGDSKTGAFHIVVES